MLKSGGKNLLRDIPARRKHREWISQFVNKIKKKTQELKIFFLFLVGNVRGNRQDEEQQYCFLKMWA